VLEQEQLELMRKLVSKDLKLVEKFYDGKAEEKDFKKLQVLQVRVSKYLDKLHASRQTQEHSGEIPLVIQISKEIAEKNGINPSTENNSKR
jgi:hypothetical protein